MTINLASLHAYLFSETVIHIRTIKHLRTAWHSVFQIFPVLWLFPADVLVISVALYAMIHEEYPARSFSYNAGFEVKEVIKMFAIILSAKNIFIVL